MKKKQAPKTALLLMLVIFFVGLFFIGIVLFITGKPTGSVIKTITQECWTDTQSEAVKKARELSKYLAKEVYPSYQLTAPEIQFDLETIQLLSQELVESFTSKNPTLTQMNQSAQENKEIISNSIELITKTQLTLEAKQGSVVLIRFIRQLKNVFEEVAKTTTQTLECIA